MGESDIIDMEDDEKGETAATRGGTPGPPFTPSPATAYPLFQHKSYRNPESNPRPSSGQPARPSPRPRASPVHLTRRPARVPAPVLPERRAASAGLFASGGASARVSPALSTCLCCPRLSSPLHIISPPSPLFPLVSRDPVPATASSPALPARAHPLLPPYPRRAHKPITAPPLPHASPRCPPDDRRPNPRALSALAFARSPLRPWISLDARVQYAYTFPLPASPLLDASFPKPHLAAHPLRSTRSPAFEAPPSRGVSSLDRPRYIDVYPRPCEYHPD